MILFDFWNRTNGSCEETGIGPLLIVTTGAMQVDNPIMKYLDASTGGEANKVFENWEKLNRELGASGWLSRDTQFQQLIKGLTKKYVGRQIVLLVDEIIDKQFLSKLKKQSFPESLRIILILNPRESKGSPLSLPDFFLHVTLTTPYRSTIAITRLARFITKSK